MTRGWIRIKYHDFVRDILRDFCLAGLALEEQFEMFDRDGHVDFNTVRELLGGGMNKGLLWRLKDSAHHLFRNDVLDLPVGHLLDYAIGYLFHETLKLKESAYQQLKYAPALQAVPCDDVPGLKGDACAGFRDLMERSKGETAGLVANLRALLDGCRDMFPIYLAHHGDNPLLARYFFESEEVIRLMFRNRFDSLIEAVYGDAPERRFLLAGQSLRAGGWTADAARALDAAEQARPGSPDVAAERERYAEC